MNIGIVSYGLYLPSTFDSAEDVARRSGLTVEAVRALGIRRKCSPGESDQPVAMAVAAARQALERAEGLNPDQVDAVIWTGEEYKDYIAQTPSIRLQEEIGCKKAWAFDLVGQGVTMIQGLKVAKDLIAGDKGVRTVMLAGGTRNVDLVDDRREDTRFLLAASVSGGAIMLQEDYSQNHLVDTAFCIDAHMADAVYVPGGGTEHPFSTDTIDSEAMFYQTQNPGLVNGYLSDKWASSLCNVTRKVLAGAMPDYVALRHLRPADRLEVLRMLDLTPEHSAALDDWGHHGTNDPILSLDIGIRTKAVTDGALVAMVTGGIGFSYAAALVRWGHATE